MRIATDITLTRQPESQIRPGVQWWEITGSETGTIWIDPTDTGVSALAEIDLGTVDRTSGLPATALLQIEAPTVRAALREIVDRLIDTRVSEQFDWIDQHGLTEEEAAS